MRLSHEEGSNLAISNGLCSDPIKPLILVGTASDGNDMVDVLFAMISRFRASSRW